MKPEIDRLIKKLKLLVSGGRFGKEVGKGAGREERSKGERERRMKREGGMKTGIYDRRRRSTS
jgi:hypothetical protein